MQSLLMTIHIYSGWEEEINNQTQVCMGEGGATEKKKISM